MVFLSLKSAAGGVHGNKEVDLAAGGGKRNAESVLRAQVKPDALSGHGQRLRRVELVTMPDETEIAETEDRGGEVPCVVRIAAAVCKGFLGKGQPHGRDVRFGRGTHQAGRGNVRQWGLREGSGGSCFQCAAPGQRLENALRSAEDELQKSRVRGERAWFEQTAQGFAQSGFLERFGQQGHLAERAEALSGFFRKRGQNQNGGRALQREFAQAGNQLGSAQTGHAQVGADKVEGLVPGRFEGGNAVGGGDCAPPAQFRKIGSMNVCELGLVVDDENRALIRDFGSAWHGRALPFVVPGDRKESRWIMKCQSVGFCAGGCGPGVATRSVPGRGLPDFVSTLVHPPRDKIDHNAANSFTRDRLPAGSLPGGRSMPIRVPFKAMVLTALFLSSACKKPASLAGLESACSDEYMKVRSDVPDGKVLVFEDQSISNARGYVGHDIPVIRRRTVEIRNPGAGFPCRQDRRVMEVNVRGGTLANQIVWICAEHLTDRNDASCAGNPSIPDNPTVRALANQGLLSQEIGDVRIGRVWFDKPLDGFATSADIGALKAELRKAANRASDAKYTFVKCEMRPPHMDSTDPAQCAYLLDKDSGAEFEFVAVPSDGARICQDLNGCTIHQAIRVKGWNNGVQRPALFVEKRTLPHLVWLTFRPRVDAADLGGTLASNGNFGNQLGAKVAADLGQSGKTFANLIDVSNFWQRGNVAADLNAARWNTFLIITGGLSLGSGAQAVAVLRAGQSVTTLAKIMAVIDLAAAGASVVETAVALLDLRAAAQEFRPGPARSAVQAAVAIADAAPWLGLTSIGQHLVGSGAQVLLRWRALDEVAARRGVQLTALSQQTVDEVVGRVDRHAGTFAAKLKAGDGPRAQQILDDIVDDTTARLTSSPVQALCLTSCPLAASRFSTIYENARLSRDLTFSPTRQSMAAAYDVARRNVTSTLDEDLAFLESVAKRAKDGHAPSAEQMARLKDIRVNLKSLRFAYGAFDKSHEYPAHIDELTTVLGHIQDGYSFSGNKYMFKKLEKLRHVLKKSVGEKILRELSDFRLDDPAKFSRWLNEQKSFLAESLRRGRMTAPEYHEVRKCVSRLVTVLDSYKQVLNSSDFDDALKVLSTINGRMGQVHDGLTATRVGGTMKYEDQVVTIAQDIGAQIGNFVAHFKVAG